MEEIKQVSYEEAMELAKGFPIQPLYRKVIVTLNMVEDESGVILSNEGLSEIQYVLAADETSPIRPGDKVILDLEKMITKVPSETDQHQLVTKLKIDLIEVDEQGYAFVEDRYIKAIDRR